MYDEKIIRDLLEIEGYSLVNCYDAHQSKDLRHLAFVQFRWSRIDGYDSAHSPIVRNPISPVSAEHSRSKQYVEAIIRQGGDWYGCLQTYI